MKRRKLPLAGPFEHPADAIIWALREGRAKGFFPTRRHIRRHRLGYYLYDRRPHPLVVRQWTIAANRRIDRCIEEGMG